MLSPDGSLPACDKSPAGSRTASPEALSSSPASPPPSPPPAPQGPAAGLSEDFFASLRAGSSRAPPRKPSARPRPRAAVARPGHARAPRARAAVPAGRIQRMGAACAGAVRVGQAILDAAAVVKELVENALDAGATRVDVRLEGRAAAERVVVTDNGRGVRVRDHAALCEPHSTSKIGAFGDLDAVGTYGFRGEAMSAIAALAGSVSVVTRTEGEEVGHALTYSSDGKLLTSEQKMRNVGTTVQVEKLFARLPVRLQDAQKHSARDITRCLAVVQDFAMIACNVRFELRIGKDTRLVTQPKAGVAASVAMLSAITAVLGKTLASALVPFRGELSFEDGVETNDAPEDSEGQATFADLPRVFSVRGYVSGPGHKGIGSSKSVSASHMYMNERPVDMPRVTKGVNEAFRRSVSIAHGSPLIVLAITAPPGTFDINVSPDKRQVAIFKESALIARLVELLEGIWCPPKERSIPVNSLELRGAFRDFDADDDAENSVATKRDEVAKMPRASVQNRGAELDDIKDSMESKDDMDAASRGRSSPPRGSGDRRVIAEADGGAQPRGDGVRKTPVDLCEQGPTLLRADGLPSRLKKRTTQEAKLALVNGPKRSRLSVANFIARRTAAVAEASPSVPPESEGIVDSVSLLDRANLEVTRSIGHPSSVTNAASLDALPVAERVVVLSQPKRRRSSTSANPDVTESVGVVTDQAQDYEDEVVTEVKGSIKFSLQDIREVREKRKRSLTCLVPLGTAVDMDSKRVKLDADYACTLARKPGEEELSPTDVETDAEREQAEQELVRIFRQEWFRDLKILGQFNLSFIICSLAGKDLFIVDQHASDEKYNYEDLQTNTVIHTQRLLKPMALDLSVEDELIVSENLHRFRKGGFELKYKSHKPPTKRVYLVSQPASKRTMFVFDDLVEMINRLKETQGSSDVTSNEILRPARTHAMFASRACQKAVTVGVTLSAKRMKTIVEHLASLAHPWACPHGRPTMRHLVDMDKC